MPLPPAEIPHYPIQVLTLDYHIQGTLEPIGPIINYLNDVNRQYIPFMDATVNSLTPGPLSKVSRPQLIIPKTDIVAIYLDDAAARASVQHMKRVERYIAYLPGLVCRGEFHLGADTRWQDVLSLMVADFFGVTSVTAFPLVTLPGPFPQQADLLILNRLHVKMLHLDQA